MAGRLAGKIAFITGVARGQGRAHAVRMAEEGADIIGLDLCGPIESVSYPPSSPEDLAETVAQVEALDRRMVAMEADVRDVTAVTAAVEAGVNEFGRLDIVCANAGNVTYSSNTLEIDEQTWADVLDVNITGVWNTIRAAADALIASGAGGSIVITSSQAGLRGYHGIGHYVAAKHGVVGLMKTFALEFGRYGIRVNCILPASTDTPMLQNEQTYRLFLPDDPNPTREAFAELAKSRYVLPVAWMDPVDQANAALFLASDEARNITGVALPVDAGGLLI